MKNIAMLLLVILFFFGGGTLSIVMSLNESLRRKLRPKATHHGIAKIIDRIMGIVLGVAFWFAGIWALSDFLWK